MDRLLDEAWEGEEFDDPYEEIIDDEDELFHQGDD